MTATVKQELPATFDPVPGTVEPNLESSDAMGYVRYFVSAAFNALFGGNFEAQAAAVAALPANWGPPLEVLYTEEPINELPYVFSFILRSCVIKFIVGADTLIETLNDSSNHEKQI